MRDNKEDFILIDVREEWEYEISKIEGSKLIPLNTIPEAVKDLDTDKNYVVMCKMGGRSASAVEHLLDNGFKNVKNLIGGITQWVQTIDTSQSTY